MKVKMTTTIVGADFKTPMIDENKKPVLIKNLLVNAVLGQDRQEMPGEEKLERFELAKKISGASPCVEVTAKELTLIRNSVQRVYPPILVGQLEEVLSAAEK
jgi:hypothetical protein